MDYMEMLVYLEDVWCKKNLIFLLNQVRSLLLRQQISTFLPNSASFIFLWSISGMHCNKFPMCEFPSTSVFPGDSIWHTTKALYVSVCQLNNLPRPECLYLLTPIRCLFFSQFIPFVFHFYEPWISKQE